MFHFGTINNRIFFVLFILSLSYKSNAIEIQIKQGILRGFKQHSRNGTEYQAFLGIPYARPPTGNLRFEVSRFSHSKFDFFSPRYLGNFVFRNSLNLMRHILKVQSLYAGHFPRKHNYRYLPTYMIIYQVIRG